MTVSPDIHRDKLREQMTMNDKSYYAKLGNCLTKYNQAVA